MMEQKIVIYGHSMCPMVGPVKSALEASGADYEYIDIIRDRAAREHVREINQGYTSVPTLLFPDGSTLTEPTGGELNAKLSALGYDTPVGAFRVLNLPRLLMLTIAAYVLLRVVGVA